MWWRFEFDDDVPARLRATVRDWNDLSINALELLGMVATALNFVTQSDARPTSRHPSRRMSAADRGSLPLLHLDTH